MMTITCDTSAGYIILNSQCLSCKTLPYSTGIAINNTDCVCQGTFTWYYNTQSCICSYYGGKAQYMNGSVCTVCGLINDSTTEAYCNSCSGGNFAYSRLGCVDCSSIPYGVGTMNVSYGVTCKCQTGYKFVYALTACVCDISQSYALSATGKCIPCSSLASPISTYCRYCIITYYSNNLTCQPASTVPNLNTTSLACKTGYTKQQNIFTLVN